ncbi:pyridoxal phosphate-dependent transferase [Aspergillus pseudoustus]|uniref:Pyridoxal phosphate-dependent transferase n=1 Tax=Aspergillus pseudoustus TaxID=1810923 RepID=A0ABR4KYB2_9EURO
MECTTVLGAPVRKHFSIDPNFVNLNHGSFGTYPTAVRAALRQFQDEAEARPDPFIRYSAPKILDVSREAIANVLHVPRNECVFVKNATTGVNTILQNIPFQPGDVIVYFDTIYGALERGIFSHLESTPVQARKVQCQYPVSHDGLVDQFLEVVRKTRAEGLNVKIALFDAISSLPAFRFPFEKLTEVCRKEEILSLIDGAHGIGQVQLDLGRLQPDFFVSNCHKWLFVPRSCCVLYVPKRNQHLIRTTVPTSWGYIPPPSSSSEITPSIMNSNDPTKSPFESLFEYVGTNDDAPYFCVPAALAFRNEICGGEERIYTYLETLAKEAAERVAETLETDVLQEPDLKPEEQSQLRRCGMATVRLPIAIQGLSSLAKPSCLMIQADEVASTINWLQENLSHKYGTFVPIFALDNWLWTRLSAQVYLEISDFEWLAGVLKELCTRWVQESPVRFQLSKSVQQHKLGV